jgi:hypothetical protein
MSTQDKKGSDQSSVKFLLYKDFYPSIQKLMAKGGKYQKAATTALSAFGKATSDPNASVEAVFAGISLTNHGESRLVHCRKYDLTGFARLVTAYSNGICIFLFAGDHDAADKWLDANRGLDFIAHEVNGNREIRPVFVSDMGAGKQSHCWSCCRPHGASVCSMAWAKTSQHCSMEFFPTRVKMKF